MNTKTNILVWLCSLAAVLGICLVVNSCSPEGLTDESEFSLYYPGITDIGPSSTINVTPTYHGAKPSGFEIYKVTLNGENFSKPTESFVIEPETGIVTLSNTDNLPVGTYMISIACNSAGKRFSFENIITVNMMKPVPDGIVVEPSVLKVKLADIIGMDGNTVELPKAQIKTEGDHISIKKYLIAGVRKDGKNVKGIDKMFRLSQTGEFSVIKGNKDFIPGEYIVDFRLTTMLAGENSEEGLFVNALTVDVTSAPLSLSYKPSKGKVEAGYAFTSPAPEYIGSTGGLKFSIKAVNPACGEISINEKTGEISFKEGNSLKVGEEYTVSVKAENEYGAKEFDSIYSFEVVNYIEPVTKVTYNNIDNIIQTTSFANEVQDAIGDDIVYSFKNLPAELKDLTIDPVSGKISAPSKNKIPTGRHTVTVVAENSKGQLETTFTITVIANPYMFTYVIWGNNLGLIPEENFANQFRLNEKNKTLEIPILKSDLPKGQNVKFELDKVYMKEPAEGDTSTKGRVSIDAKGTVTIHFTDERNVTLSLIHVTVGEGEAAIKKTFPIFFHNSYPSPTGHILEYTPFALCINPVTGGEGPSPKIYDKDMKELGLDNFSIDFRRTFQYFNIDGPESHKNGQPSAKGFLYDLWSQYYAPKAPNTGSRDPVSFYSNKNDQTKPLCYFKPEDGVLKINPNKFISTDGIPANGVFLGQAPFSMTAKNQDPGKSSNKIFPIAIWFDTRF